MNLQIKHKICVLMLVTLFFAGCVTKKYNQGVSELVGEGDSILDQGSGISREWKTEFVQVFTPENRSNFPSNREMLRAHAENQIKLLDEMSKTEDRAAQKFEQASQISNLEKEKKFTSLMAESFRKNIEINQLFKEQMNLVLDDSVNNNEKFEIEFKKITKNIEIKSKERDELQNVAQSILGKKPD